MNKKIDVGLLTWHDHDNVGSNLQAYALQKKIKVLGYTCKFINYSTMSERNVFRHFIRLFFSTINDYIPDFLPERFQFSVVRFQHKFFEKTRHYNEHTITKVNRKIKIAMCGSDQIWAPNVFNPIFMLSFVDENIPKFSYAASIGLKSIPEDLKPRYEKYLSTFTGISVREEQGKKLLESFINKKVDLVLDPTFLIKSEEWKNIAYKPQIKDKYIFGYFLSDNLEYRQCIEKIARKKGLKTVIFSKYKSDANKTDVYKKFMGPQNFLGYINNADLVLTDSFHGVALSINLNKEFWALKRFKENDILNQNSRLINILSICGLKDRFINSFENISFDAIDYSDVNKRLDRERNISETYLKNALSWVK